MIYFFFISERVGSTGIHGMAPRTGVILIKGSSEMSFTDSVTRDLVTLIRVREHALALLFTLSSSVLLSAAYPLDSWYRLAQ